MAITETKQWQDLKRIVINTKDFLSRNESLDIDVFLDLVIDIRANVLRIEDGDIRYNIEQSEGEIVDYLKVKELQDITYGLPMDFTVYDSTYETGWDYISDSYDDGEIINEEWYEGTEFREDLQVIHLGIQDNKEFVKRLEDEKVETSTYISLQITKDNVNVGVGKYELDDKDLEYYEKKELVLFFKDLLALDNNQKELAKSISLKPPVQREGIEDIHNEFISNIQVLLTGIKFNNLIRDYTILEQDESYLYINTENKTATLHRYFKGSYFNANTVNNLPLTLTTQYELEDKGSVISTAHPKWGSDILNGRLQRKLKVEQDYYKFARLIEHHFPSLKGDNGTLQPLEMSLRLGDVKLSKSSHTPHISSYGVVGYEKGNIRNEQILAQVSHHFGLGVNKERTVAEVEAFSEEYEEFINWLMSNLDKN